MTDTSSKSAPKDIGTLLIASLFIGLGLVTLQDVSTYSDTDSVVFPTTVAYALIGCSAMVILASWLRPNPDNGFGGGDWWRRILLVASMIAGCLVMPLAGFLPATAIAFAGGLIAARHEGWDLKSAFVFALSGIFIMAAFYALFRYPLGVPLP
ncbi:TRAP transporter [Hoeflea sp. BAL378]|uniref:tripartite tricarboxylate transporter TctB family protein n=1 Tax=Hoeflea sp. BAL378 TaxID=1547437 RepID=UPI000513BE00|nr:tripartite tricarboxylate transporter TctB family protein [Hoeflea sp. BAL378]KGF70935.1 TRAP transporter [Hoeflea sp. BAL378]